MPIRCHLRNCEALLQVKGHIKYQIFILLRCMYTYLEPTTEQQTAMAGVAWTRALLSFEPQRQNTQRCQS